MIDKNKIKKEIEEVTKDYWHVIDCYPATTQINTPRALMQVSAKVKLDTLYATIEEKRPRYKFDDMDKLNY